MGALEEILQRHPVWRGGALAKAVTALPTGFAAPCPVFSLSASSVSQSQTLTLTATPQPGTDYILTTAYISQGTAWNPYTLSGNNAAPSYSSALASLTLSSGQLTALSLGTHLYPLYCRMGLALGLHCPMLQRTGPQPM